MHNAVIVRYNVCGHLSLSLSHSLALPLSLSVIVESYHIFEGDVSGADPNRSLEKAIHWSRLVEDMNV